jgi:hypothetical protein
VTEIYTALELARAAGYTIRHVPTGGMTVYEDERLISMGPDTDELELLRVVQRHLADLSAERSA